MKIIFDRLSSTASAPLLWWLFLSYLLRSWLLFVSHLCAAHSCDLESKRKDKRPQAVICPEISNEPVFNKHCRLLLGSRAWYTDRTSDVFNTINHGAWSVQTPLPDPPINSHPLVLCLDLHLKNEVVSYYIYYRCFYLKWFTIAEKLLNRNVFFNPSLPTPCHTVWKLNFSPSNVLMD